MNTTPLKMLILLGMFADFLGMLRPSTPLFASPQPSAFKAEIISISSGTKSPHGSVASLWAGPTKLKKKVRPKPVQLQLCLANCSAKSKPRLSPKNFELCPGMLVDLRTIRIGKLVFIKKLTRKPKLGGPQSCKADPLPTASPTAVPTEVPTGLPSPVPTESPSKFKLPIEILGGAGTTETVNLFLSNQQASGARSLFLMVHGLQYDDKALVTINKMHSVALSNTTVKVLGNAKNFGGIGGGFHTIPMEIEIPLGTFKPGANSIDFIYTRKDSYQVSGFKQIENQIDDASSGFRVIKFNLHDSLGRDLIEQSNFELDNPIDWGAPKEITDLPKAIAAGRLLWSGFKANGTAYKLLNHSPIGLTRREIKATCADCHAKDGRDLKYYNYSNHSIIARAKIHGLSEQEGRQIAAYIRTLPNTPVVAQARPWNPPFQPGPGLDSKPVYEWAAGAGLEAVIEDPMDLFNYIFPGSYTTDTSGQKVWDVSKITPEPLRPSANISMREAPIVLQLMDWNHWLPKVHPFDSYEDLLESNAQFKASFEWFLKVYDGPNNPNSLRSYAASKNYVMVSKISLNILASFYTIRSSYPFDSMNHTLKEAQRRYALLLLPIVKFWEVYMEFDLGDKVARASCGPQADERSWRMGTLPFGISPNMANIKNTDEEGVPEVEVRDGHAIGNNTSINFTYFSTAWYHLQLILDHGNRNPLCGVSAGAPYDWGYVFGHLKDLAGTNRSGITTIPLTYLYIAKGMQIYDTGLGVDQSNNGGWNPASVSPLPLHEYSYGGVLPLSMTWKNTTPAARAKLFEVIHRAWLDTNKQSSVAQYFKPVVESAPTSYLAYQPASSRLEAHNADTFAYRVFKMLTWKVGSVDLSTKGFGVSPELHNELVDWAKTIWPKNGDGTPAPWDSIRQ